MADSYIILGVGMLSDSVHLKHTILQNLVESTVLTEISYLGY